MRHDEMKIERSGVPIKSEHALVLGSADLTSRCEPTAPQSDLSPINTASTYRSATLPADRGGRVDAALQMAPWTLLSSVQTAQMTTYSTSEMHGTGEFRLPRLAAIERPPARLGSAALHPHYSERPHRDVALPSPKAHDHPSAPRPSQDASCAPPPLSARGREIAHAATHSRRCQRPHAPQIHPHPYRTRASVPRALRRPAT